MPKKDTRPMVRNQISQIETKLRKIGKLLDSDSVLKNDIEVNYNFVPPYTKATQIDEIKLIMIGQDPTVRREESRRNIKVTLNLDKENSLRSYLKKVCDFLQLNIDKEVYATNLYKCFFKIPPADDRTILLRHFKLWMDLLIGEIAVFNKAFIITLGEPLITQLIHSNSKKVRYYWDYIGQTKSGGDFKCIESSENYLQKRIYPLPHQPSWSRNKFYKKYLNDYLEFVKRNEGLIKM